jgi:hypothetical protein
VRRVSASKFRDPNQLDLFGPKVPKVVDHTVTLFQEPKAVAEARVFYVAKYRRPPKVLMRQPSYWYVWVPRPEPSSTGLLTSRWDGHPGLGAIEGVRSFCGMSIDIVGAYQHRYGEATCDRCLTHVWFGGTASPLFEAAMDDGRPRKGTEFKCCRCGREFVADLNER